MGNLVKGGAVDRESLPNSRKIMVSFKPRPLMQSGFHDPGHHTSCVKILPCSAPQQMSSAAIHMCHVKPVVCGPDSVW